jgi:hypothetical protein
MTTDEPHDEEELAELLAELPPAPEPWVRRAQALAPQEESAQERAEARQREER